jgi:hypothetical protein
MIYDAVPAGAPFRQGDIFRGLPKAEFSMADVVSVIDSGVGQAPQFQRGSWDVFSRADAQLTALVPIRQVKAILITQTCDAAHAEALSFCEIGLFSEVAPGLEGARLEKFVKAVTKQAKDDQRWFYLPPGEIGFTERMAVDFRSVFSLDRDDLARFESHRVGRLTDVAAEHFREKLAEFFRRYPYDPWYPLTREEFEIYLRDHPGEEPFRWQRS